MNGMRTLPAVLAALIFASSTGLAAAEAQSFYKDSPTVFAISRDPANPAAEVREPGCGSAKNATESANVAVVEFSEHGDFVDDLQLKAAVDCISQERQKNRSGVVVMVFVHGWRHDSSWEDQNFRDFRAVLTRLALREAEAAGGTYRRVIGVYVGWPGGRLTQFGRRYDSAQRIGRSAALQQAIQNILKTTKEESANEEVGSPFILAGHSMGALMLQTAFSALLDAGGIGAVAASPAQQRRCSRVVEGDRVVVLPDLVLLLNSATDSQITKRIGQQLRSRQVSKIVDCAGRRFRAPLFISASSENDYATLWGFWATTLGRSKTDGNDDELINHKLTREGGAFCPPIPGVRDFGQSWHCLRQPDIRGSQVVSMRIDLPQAVDSRDPCHVRYRLDRNPAAGGESLFWVFQVPSELIDGHGDIFNGRSSLLMMALIQMSGATMSVHRSYSAVFEPEVGSCRLP